MGGRVRRGGCWPSGGDWGPGGADVGLMERTDGEMIIYVLFLLIVTCFLPRPMGPSVIPPIHARIRPCCMPVYYRLITFLCIVC